MNRERSAVGPALQLTALLIPACLLVIAPIVGLQDGADAGLLVVAGAAVAAAAGVPLFRSRTYDPLEPYTLVWLALVLGVSLKTVFVYWGDRHLVESYTLVGEPPDVLLPGILVILVATVASSIGYIAPRPGAPGLLRGLADRRFDASRTRLVAGIFMAIAAISIALFIRRMGISVATLADISGKRFLKIEDGEYTRTALGYYQWGAMLFEFAGYLLLATYRGSSHKVSHGLLAAAGLVGGAFFYFFTSNRYGLITLGLTAVTVWNYCARPLTLRLVAIVGTAGAALFMVTTLLRVGDAGGDRGPAVQVIEQTIGSRHFVDLGKTSRILSEVPGTLDHRHGATLLTWLVAPIPRVWWPGKPPLGSGPILGPALFDTGVAGVPPGLIGELHLNFGLVGILPGMLIAGLLLRLLYELFRRYLDQPVPALLYAVVLVPASFGLMTFDVSKIVVQVLVRVLPALLALVLVSRAAVVHADT